MEARLIDLETRLSFQEHTLSELNDVIVDQQKQLDLLSRRLEAAENRLRAMQPSQIANQSDETPPPHY